MNSYFERSELEYVDLRVPKFQIIAKNDLVDTLKNFGITDLFDPYLADFGRMTNKTVFIGNIIQISNLVIDDFDLTEPHFIPKMDENSTLTIYEFYVRSPFLFLVFSFGANFVHISAVVTNPNVY
ncbi:hypothetical protein RF11_15486 [Thelohanellus kitauei]|nr:hypothetical protein RF11_15486 [Thelohanellus kitauei]